MGLSKELIQQFVKATNDLQEQNSETFVLGTAVISDGKTYVKIDGSESLTPIKTTTKVNQGDRVTVMIKNHTATITGNITSPSVDKNVVENKIDEFGTIIANDITAQNGKIDNLIAENVTIKGDLTAVNAEIENLTAENVNINGKLTANEAEIEDLKVKKLDVETAKIEFATIENLNATNAEVNTIKGNFADFSQLTAEDLTAINANIKNLQAEKLNAKEAEIKYANIDFANIGMAAIEKLFADSGIIKDLVVNDQHITGELVGVTIKGDLIEGNTIVADKLVVKGSDGLYYKLNTDGMKVEAEQTEYNSLNGSIITAKSITASKVMVDDLVAFDATIGGFKITNSSIYSGVKESATNTTRGIYLDKTGQVSFGDANNFLKFFKDTDGVWKLAISANSIKLSASSADLETALDDINNKVQNTTKSIEEQFAISNSSTTAPTSGWSTTPPTWQNGKYIWSKTITTYTDGRISESKPVCITGAKGETGASGSAGATGTGITSITEEYYLSTSKTTQTGGSWVTTPPTWSKGKYMWTRSKIVYKNPTSTVYTTPICDNSWEAVNDVEKRVADAEQKIEPGKITATVEDQIKKNGSTVVASKSYVIQEANKVIHKFTSTGGHNLLKNSDAKNGQYMWSGNGLTLTIGTSGGSPFFGGNEFRSTFPNGLRYSESIKLKDNTDYVYEGWIYCGMSFKGTGATPLHYWCMNTPDTPGQAQLEVLDYRQDVTANIFNKCYVHFRTKSGDVYFTPFVYGGPDGQKVSVRQLSLTEGKVETAWTPHPSEIYEGSTIIDGSGVTINNGALTVKNKAGQTVLSGDSDGNLSLTGSLVVSSNKNQILRVDTADTKYPHMVIDAYGAYMDRLSVTSDYTGYAQQKAVDGVFIRNDSMTIYGTGERLFMQGDLRAGGKITTTRIETTSSGQTNNIKIGDDCYIGDFNTANMFRISGVSNSAHGGIKFGNGGEIKYIGNTQLDFMGGAYFSSTIRVAGHLNPMSTMTVDGTAIFRTTPRIDATHPYVDFRSPTGTRRGYVGYGAGTEDPLYIVTDINQYILVKGHFCPGTSKKYWIGTNSPDQKWKGLCAEGGTVGASDIRQKENIERLDGTIVNYDDLTGEIKEYELLNLKGESIRATSTDYYEFIKDRFKPSYYNYKLSDSLNGDGTFSIDPQAEYDMLKNVGFLAQDYDLETDTVAKEFIFADEDGNLSYNHMSYVTVGMIALQEAIKKIEVLEERIKQLELC